MCENKAYGHLNCASWEHLESIIDWIFWIILVEEQEVSGHVCIVIVQAEILGETSVSYDNEKPVKK